MKNGKIGFYLGALSDNLEKQANEQGCTLGENAEKWEKAAESLLRLRFNLDLPDGMYHDLQKRLIKMITKDLISTREDQ